MSPTNKKTMLMGIIALALILVVCTALYIVFAINNAKQQQGVRTYLDQFEEKAGTYLLTNKDFVDTYGTDCKLDAYSWSYGYADPHKYPTFTFKPTYPPTFEDFETELDHLSVSFTLPDGRACTVEFKKGSAGGMVITGWGYVDEETES